MYPRSQTTADKHLIHLIAVENLVGYSAAQPSLFKSNDLRPIKDLKLLVKDYTVRCARSYRKAKPLPNRARRLMLITPRGDPRSNSP